ncbi:MAG: hypothetical protein ABI779_22860 [Acidobacteriota bacterium]
MRRGLWLVLVFTASTLVAQSPAMQPFEVNMERVKFSAFGGNSGTTTTYLIPTVNLQVSVAGAVWAKAGRTKAHARYYVDGMSKEMLQALAKDIQDDLVTRLRGAGYTVLTYDDVKSEPEVVSHQRNTIDKEYGVPTTGGFDLPGGFGKPVKFALVSPSDEQSFDSPIQGPAWWLRGIAKAKNLTVIVPELTFNAADVRRGFQHGVQGLSRRLRRSLDGLRRSKDRRRQSEGRLAGGYDPATWAAKSGGSRRHHRPRLRGQHAGQPRLRDDEAGLHHDPEPDRIHRWNPARRPRGERDAGERDRETASLIEAQTES